jgi:hypothetical protein
MADTPVETVSLPAEEVLDPDPAPVRVAGTPDSDPVPDRLRWPAPE